MTPEDAIQIVDSACATLQTNRDGHIKLVEAISTLKELVEKKPAGKKTTKH